MATSPSSSLPLATHVSSTLSALSLALSPLLAHPGTTLASAGALSFLWLWRRSLPLAWTLRILFTANLIKYQASSSLWSFLFPGRVRGRGRARASTSAWEPESGSRTTSAPPYLLSAALPPPGTCIFAESHTSRHTASIDECDFNMHLSNSSYPKNLDFARTEFAARRYAVGIHSEPSARVWFALGGTSFRFLKEIPLGREYAVRCRVEAWDEKWVYVVGEFISSPPRSRSKSRKSNSSSEDEAPAPTETLHCISLARLCIKSNRKTIPPWLFFALCGYTPSGCEAPTRNWERAEALRRRLLLEGKKPVGVLERYVPEGGQAGEREEWMQREYWDVDGWEEQRRQRLEAVRKWSLLGE